MPAMVWVVQKGSSVRTSACITARSTFSWAMAGVAASRAAAAMPNNAPARRARRRASIRAVISCSPFMRGIRAAVGVIMGGFGRRMQPEDAAPPASRLECRRARG
jgi:hypothetical protein